jgi:enediyne biosynthesis protein E4
MKRLFIVAYVLLFFSCGKTTRFEKLSADDTGIDFINTIVEKDSFNILHNEYMYNGGGVGVADLNNDGLSDLIFTGNKVSPKVYLNRGDFSFTDITGSFENLSNDQWFSGVTIVDINADTWPDVYMTSTSDKDPEKRKNRLWVNQGKGPDAKLSFKEMAEEFGIADKNYSVHSGFFDYDLDGDLDLYILNNIVNKSIPTNYRPRITDGSSINNDKFYRNEGNGKFIDITKEAGIVYEGYGLGLAFGDINKDGYPDIYVSNDYISNDLLYINQRNGTFKNQSENFLSYQSRFSMGNEMVDVNNDGNLDIMSVDMMPEQYFRKKQTINGNSYLVYINNEKYGYEPQFVRNMLHLHNGFINGEMLPFSEVGQMMGIFETEWSWSPLFADYDNDGDRDLLLTNGFPKDLTDKDFTNYKAQVYGFVASDRHILGRIPVVKVPNYAYENTGAYSFEDKTEEWGMKIPSFSNGAAFADLDNDGDLDYVVNNINDVAFVYRNNTIGKLEEKKNYLKIKLQGAAPNTMAIGAKVEMWADGKYQYYEHFLTRGYISSVDPVIHFGLGSDATIDSLRVTWPLQKLGTVLKNVAVNQLLLLKEEEASVEPVWAKKPITRDNYLFEKKDGVIDYLHKEEDYVDFFQEQRILQHKLSQIGPCMTKGDLNKDGNDDLVVGGSKNFPSSVFLFKNGRFEKTEIPGLTGPKTCTESDMVLFDLEGDGDQDLISIAGGYENEKEAEYEHFLYRNSGKSFEKIKLPLPAFPGSVVRPFDYDHDGDADLFVGARVKRAMYPLAPQSYIVVNNKGEFSGTPLPFELGMVTDAVWSDYNRDGWEDLVIAREWNSVTILQNDKGQNFSVVKNEKLESLHGFWSSVTKADLDKDGDDDYVIGNLGDNHRFTVSEQFPMRLYAIDIDKNSFIDPVATSYWKDEKGVMREYPINYLDELAAQSPFFRKQFTSYTRFSYTPADSIIDRSNMSDKDLFYVNSTGSYILWNNSGTFEWEKLPAEVQTAPVKKILVEDCNSDGTLDMIIAGNDFTYDVSTGYYDANKGVLLLGNADKTFTVMPPSKSGLLLKGQVTSLLYFQGTPSFLVTGINRDSICVYQTNTAKFSGLKAQ